MAADRPAGRRALPAHDLPPRPGRRGRGARGQPPGRGPRAAREAGRAARCPSCARRPWSPARAAEVEDFVRRTAPRWSSRSTGSPAPTCGCVESGPACRALAESATGGGRHVIVQEYLPSVTDGNKRLFLVDGEIVGAVLRRPSDDDFRIGPPVAAPTIDAADRRIAERPRPAARRPRHRGRRRRRHRRPADRGQRDLPRRHAQDRRPARHRPQRRDRAPPARPDSSPRGTPVMTTIPVVCIALMGVLLFAARRQRDPAPGDPRRHRQPGSRATRPTGCSSPSGRTATPASTSRRWPC